jgi:hypothetical protein
MNIADSRYWSPSGSICRRFSLLRTTSLDLSSRIIKSYWSFIRDTEDLAQSPEYYQTLGTSRMSCGMGSDKAIQI